MNPVIFWPAPPRATTRPSRPSTSPASSSAGGNAAGSVQNVSASKRIRPSAATAGTPFASTSVELEVGDTCLLYSDGITEYSDSEENLFGEQRLLRFLEARRTLEPERLVRELEAELERFAKGTQPRDDVTLVLLRRLA